MQLDQFTRHYLIAALWSSNVSNEAGNGAALDNYFDVDDVGPNTINQAIEDCRDFQQANAAMLERAYAFYRDSGMAAHDDAGSPEACAGHDFWLTRNRHGAGFWDRGIPDDVCDALTSAAGACGGVDIDQWDMLDPTAAGALDNEDAGN